MPEPLAPGVAPPNPRPESSASADAPGAHRAGLTALTVAALGVVFGDIGTSPLYAMQTVFSIDGGVVQPTPGDVYGVVSLMFWAITLVVSVKYLTFVLRADNDGEGGIMALIALVQRHWGTRRASMGLVLLGVFGASLFYGDSIITPSISVLSAVEGLKVAAPSLAHAVVEIAIVVLAILFLVQRHGTQRVGGLFGPIMLIWFAALAAVGLRQIVPHPGVVRGLSPSYAFEFIGRHPYTSFVALGAVVLVITGAEALYADMGHFGRPPIRRAWLLVVFPALTLNYLGQASLILHDPKAISNPFYLLVPEWGRWPMIVLATLATVIASQAVISGAFSVSRQAMQLGFLPRLTVRQTHEHEGGQIYVASVNWTLFVAVAILIVGFGSSARLATAYGVAVTGTFIIDTVLFLVVARLLFRWRKWQLALAGLCFLTADVSFFAANLSKVLHGGWFPLGVAFSVYTLMVTWQKGRQIVTRNRALKEGPLREFIQEIHARQVPRIPGLAVFPHINKDTVPLAMRANVEHNHVLQEHVVIVSVQTENVPHVPRTECLALDDLGYADDGIFHLSFRVGFSDRPDIPLALALACAFDHPELQGVDPSEASYFLSRISLKRTKAPGLSRWRKALFTTMSRHAANPAEYFGLPDDQTVIMGSHVEV